jgi:hypothetical protein
MTEPVPGITASTKRNPAAVSGKIGAAVTKIASLTLTYAPMPVSPEVVELYKLNSPRKTFVTGVMGDLDIIEGDLLTTGGVTYTVRAVGKYSGPISYRELLIEEVK